MNERMRYFKSRRTRRILGATTRSVVVAIIIYVSINYAYKGYGYDVNSKSRLHAVALVVALLVGLIILLINYPFPRLKLDSARYKPRVLNWTEPVNGPNPIDMIISRMPRIHVLETSEGTVSFRVGSSYICKVMGTMFTARWLPMRIDVSVKYIPDNRIDIEVMATDSLGVYSHDILFRKGQLPAAEQAFEKRFQSICRQLGASIAS